MVASFEADHKLLKEFIPHKTELADWNGKFYMSLVGFLFEKPSLLGIPSPIFRKFEEINLRFYVRRKIKNGWRKGVVFIKEIAPSSTIGLFAKWLYGENFISLPTKHSIKKIQDETQLCYNWKVRDGWNHMKLRYSNKELIPPPESLEAFIHDHFYGYTYGKNRSREFCIEHKPWKIFPGLSFGMKLNARELYGEAFSHYFNAPVSMPFLMDGSRTKVSFPTFI
jgi:uncharacterized protein YqjF (DUF2071 family)